MDGIKFEKVSRFAETDISLPVRKTKASAGYDFEVAEDIVIPTSLMWQRVMADEAADIFHIVASATPCCLLFQRLHM